MVDPEHLRFLHGASPEDLRTWRKINPDTPFDLAGADLSSAVFNECEMEDFDFSLADLSHAKFIKSKLHKCWFTRANVTDAQFVDAKLVRADFTRADLAGANLRNADLTSAYFHFANLRSADLRGATFSNAMLFDANLSEAQLDDADFSGAFCGRTIFANVDLSRARGLDQVRHKTISTVGLDTLQRSKGSISINFLDACGIPQSVIKALRGKYRIGDTVGPWLLRERLGEGGNGEVWKAQGGGRVVALKIIKTLDRNDARYKRFGDEVCILRELKEWKRIIPLIEASVPTIPSYDDPGWLAMPIAIPMTERLADVTWSLTATVGAIASVAETLSQLHARGISHRDIKPNNLFWYDEGWAIGDFGLVDFPEKQALTKPDRKLGPLYYIAPEMLADPVRADGKPADVYSLAKTLWVLATGQQFALPGEQRADNVLWQIGSYISHDRTQILDEIQEEATRLDPDERLSMSDLAAKLRAWL